MLKALLAMEPLPPVDAESSCGYGATFVGAMLLLKVPLAIMGFSLLFFLIYIVIIFS